MSDNVQRCGNCRFYRAPFKECRRLAPVPVLIGVTLEPGNSYGACWPEVDPCDDWCGEWQPCRTPPPA